jgi:hypothetical protein
MTNQAIFNTSASGAMRESIGTKIKTNLVPYELTAMAAVGLNYGSLKYSARNFEKGLSYCDLLESLKRHIIALECGETLDADSGLPHLCLIASSTAMLCHNVIQDVVIDDRPIPKQGKSAGEVAKIAQTMLDARKPL